MSKKGETSQELQFKPQRFFKSFVVTIWKLQLS